MSDVDVKDTLSQKYHMYQQRKWIKRYCYLEIAKQVCMILSQLDVT